MTNRTNVSGPSGVRRLAGTACACVTLLIALGCKAAPPPETGSQRTFKTPDEAVRVLIAAALAGNKDQILEIFGPEGKEIAASSDAATARQNREVFTVATAEKWQLVDKGPNGKELVIGNEDWPFPIPLVNDGNGWRFDTAAGREEVIARRIGRNELAVLRACRTYVEAQRLYARDGHDGKRAGLYAKTFRSDPGKQNGLYWPAGRREKRSPLGDLVAEAAAEGRPVGTSGGDKPSPFHGYYFKILTGQGADAPGGAKDYLSKGEMANGFALIAWPAEYDVSGVMTFMVNQDGIIREKDLGLETDSVAKATTAYNPDSSWGTVK